MLSAARKIPGQTDLWIASKVQVCVLYIDLFMYLYSCMLEYLNQYAVLARRSPSHLHSTLLLYRIITNPAQSQGLPDLRADLLHRVHLGGVFSHLSRSRPAVAFTTIEGKSRFGQHQGLHGHVVLLIGGKLR